jgi:hypothetical protein
MSKAKQEDPVSKQGETEVESKDEKEESKGDGDDLTTILNKQQRADLTLLIANITESMRKLLVDNFDATAGLDKSLLREGMTEDEKMMSTDPNSDVSQYENERKKKEEYEKDLNSLKMKNLKQNSLKAYDEWRESVISRVGKVVNSEEIAKKQLEKDSTAHQAQPQAPNTIGRIKEVPPKTTSLRFKDLFPPTKTPLTKLSMQQRTLVLHSVLLLLLSLEHYVAPSRILLLNLCSSLKLPLRTFEQDEYTTAKGLLESAKELTADKETKKAAEENREIRKRKVRLATAAGAAILGISGGMAAPLVAAGVGSVMGGLGLGATAAAGYLGSVAGSTVLVGSLFGAYGGRMTGQMMDNYAREVEDFEFLSVHSQGKTSEEEEKGAQEATEHDHKLRVTICVSGWLTEKEEVVKPWRVLGTGAEVFALKYELEALLNLGNAMDGMVTSAAWGYAQKELISRTIFADLAGAMWPMALMKVSRVLDNPYSVAKSRSEKAGEVLADALINKAQGERPVTLIGYSMGAKLIYACLQNLAKRKAFGLVENIVLMGAPTPSDTSDWRVLRSVVSGRLVNVYSQNDYVLGFMYRTSALQYGVAGLQPVEGLPGIENVDVSEDVKGHLKYRYLVGAILKKIGFEDIDMKAVEEEAEALKKVEAEERKNSLQNQRKKLLRQKSYQDGKVDEDAEAEHEASQIEKKVQESTQRSLVSRVIEWWYTPSVPNPQKNAERLGQTLQKSIENPADARAAAGDTYNDIRRSTESYVQWASKHMPSMPGMGSKSTSAPVDTKNTTDTATKSANDAAKAGQSYTEYAASYLPSAKSLPSMPSRTSRGKKQTSKSQTAQASDKAADTAKSAGATAKTGAETAAGVGKDVLEPTAKNIVQPNENPAVKSAKDTAKKAPIIHQAGDKVPGAKGVGDAASTTAGNASKKISDAASNVQGKAEDTGKTATSTAAAAKDKAGDLGAAAKSSATSAVSSTKEQAGDAGKTAVSTADIASKQAQSYTSYAASYLPSAPKIPGWSSKEKSQPQEQAKKPQPPSRTASEIKKTAPKLDRTPSGLKSPTGKMQPPKLDRTPSGLKSPTGKTQPPKLDHLPSGIKSPRKLDRMPSGMKSPQNPSKLGRSLSGMKSPPASLDRTLSGMKSPPTLSRMQSGVKDGASQSLKTAQDAGGQATAGLSKVASGAKNAPGQAAKGAQAAGGQVVGAAQAGGEQLGKVISGAKDGQATRMASEGGSKVVGAGSEGAKQVGSMLGKGASSAASYVPGWGSKK